MSLAPIAKALDAVRTSLARRRWYLFGAQAAVLYGSNRFSEDLDITVFLPDGETPLEFVGVLEASGITARTRDPEFFATTRVIPAVHADTDVPIDLVLAGPGLEEVMLERAIEHRVLGAAVPVIALDDLIAMKLLAARDKDRADIRAVLEVAPASLDEARLLETLRLLDEALDLGDLVGSWERLRVDVLG